MVTLSVVLVVIATVTLIIGVLSGIDPLIFLSIGSSVVAGILLIKSVLDDRKLRVLTDGPAIDGMATTSALDTTIAEDLSVEDELAEDEGALVGAADDDDDEDEEEDLVPMGVPIAAARKPKAVARTAAKP
ncbi:MAG TPA: hypothetical protein VI541_05855, partial [Actinomycetota bacterium]|nr:hypothetical protein [Actinomycetota bacterium]